MTEGVRLVVGLGNPTSRYEKTRHNAGFWFLDRVAERLGVSLRPESRFMGAIGRRDGASPVYFLKPSTYMNRSGQSVAAVANYYRIVPSELLVVHDELDLPPGSVRLKKGGGHGGHNGLRDLIAQLGTGDFHRLRIGIGHPGDRYQVVNYVLDTPSKGELALLEEAMSRAMGEWEAVMRGEFPAVMNRLHAMGAADVKRA